LDKAGLFSFLVALSDRTATGLRLAYRGKPHVAIMAMTDRVMPSAYSFRYADIQPGEAIMTERLVTLGGGIYRLIEPGKHGVIEFALREDLKAWLDQRGVLLSVAENSLVEADSGTAALVLLPPHGRLTGAKRHPRRSQ
jgi:hypothetical protein